MTCANCKCHADNVPGIGDVHVQLAQPPITPARYGLLSPRPSHCADAVRAEHQERIRAMTPIQRMERALEVGHLCREIAQMARTAQGVAEMTCTNCKCHALADVQAEADSERIARLTRERDAARDMANQLWAITALLADVCTFWAVGEALVKKMHTLAPRLPFPPEESK